MEERRWTPQQEDAISARGGTLLVSAAAGSGKTAVLVQRVIERLTDPQNPGDISRLLVVTFTKAAAAEMKERIGRRLSELIAANPEQHDLKRQQLLLGTASICTVHSFCSSLVRENFYKLGISPDFRILDDYEMQLMRQEAAGLVLESYYEKQDPVFLDLVESFSSDRSDKRVIDTILQLYDFIRSHPFPEQWMEQKESMYFQSGNPAQTLWGECVLAFSQSALDYMEDLTNGSLEAMQEDEKLDAAYRSAYESDRAILQGMQETLQNRDWDRIGERLNTIAFEKLKSVRGYSENALKNRLSAARKEVKSTLERLKKLFALSEGQCREDIRVLAPLVRKLFELTEAFSRTLDTMKAEKKAADYGDLEHWALRLLVVPVPDGFQCTEDAKRLSEKFDEIMVDEYQDTNEAQDMLFRAISHQENNLFLVGDVKQSIYGFRQAMPELFLNRRNRSAPYVRGQNRYPACIVLDKNFRSRKEVTNSVNFVFGQLMSEQVGDVRYEGAERLDAAAPYPEKEGCETQVDILTIPPEEKSMAVLESRHIAQLIYSYIGQGVTVTEGGVQRPVTFGDFCVLLRSANQHAPQYARELSQNGVPAYAEAAGGFFDAAEIAVVLSLLRVIDNPIQDIPLLSVLMSPIYGFTPDEMAEIREYSRGGGLYSALRFAKEAGNRRAQQVISDLEEYRTLAATMTPNRLLNAIYQRTGYPDLVQAMDHGTLRLANLHLLLEYANRYEASGSVSLSGFVRFIDRLQTQNSDMAAANVISEHANVVRIMSIHKSKGLEFPICIIAGCARRFHKDTSDAVLHPELGFGVKRKNGLYRYTTLPREAILLETKREAVSEELRVLYVAMTRAKEKLIFLTSLENPQKTLGALAARISEQDVLSPYVVRSASSISDWILLCALRHPCGGQLRQLACADDDIVVHNAGTEWKFVIEAAPEPLEEQEKETASRTEAPVDLALKERIEQKIAWQYPYQELRGIPSKIAVSELAEQSSEEDYKKLPRPAFLGKQGMTPAERGTALHAYLQFCDYRGAAADARAELDRLIQSRFLTAEQAQAVELERVERFFASNLAKRMMESENCMRELRFTAEIPAEQINPVLRGSAAKERVILQGAVDCAFVENGKLVIVDYKTDRLKSPEQLWERYKLQLALYREALSEAYHMPVAQSLLYSFYLNCEVQGEG